MRKFSLENARGEVLDLTTQTTFLYEPKKLGYSRKSSILRVGNRFVITESAVDEPAPEGTMVFAGADPYAQYQDFIRFTGASPLILHYAPDEEEYELDCVLESISKEEYDSLGLLNCDVKFLGLGFWEKIVRYQVDPPADASRSWTWQATWPIAFGYSALSSHMNIVSDSNMESTCRIIIYGPCTNPIWRMTNSKGSQSGQVNVTLTKGQKLVISNANNFPTVRVYNSAGEMIQDAYQMRDFSTETFVNIAYGENDLAVGDSSGTTISFEAEVHLLYESV